MRGLLALAVVTVLAPLGVQAHGLDDAAPYGVVRIDGAAQRQQVLDAQVACRDAAYGSAPKDAAPASGTTTGGLAIGVVGDWPGALTETDYTKSQITECMGLRGWKSIDPSAEDQARFRAAQADGRRVDPYAMIAGFGPGTPRLTTLIETPIPGGMARTYTVGRF